MKWLVSTSAMGVLTCGMVMMPGPQEPSSTFGKASSATTPASEKDRKIHVLRLKHTQANEVARLLQDLNNKINMTVDERTNSVLLSTTVDELNRIEEVITRIDVPAEANLAQQATTKPARTANRSTSLFGQAAKATSTAPSLPATTSIYRYGGLPGQAPLAYAYSTWRGELPKEQRELAENLDKLEQSSYEIAQRLREAKKEDRDAVSKELKDVLTAAFAAKQKLREFEVTELKERLAKIETSIKQREDLKDKIIETRLAELSGDRGPLNWDEGASNRFPFLWGEAASSFRPAQSLMPMLARPAVAPAGATTPSAPSRPLTPAAPPTPTVDPIAPPTGR